MVVGKIGVDALAIANVISTLTLPALYLGVGYGVATGSYLSPALLRKDISAAKVIGDKALVQVFAVSTGLAILIFIGSPWIIDWFFKEESLRQMARLPFFLLGLLYIADGICCALQRFHFVGNGLRISFVIMNFVQWGVFLPLAWLGIRYLNLTYAEYFLMHIAQRFAIAGLLYLAWTFKLGARSEHFSGNREFVR